jgi:hypothetical protein
MPAKNQTKRRTRVTPTRTSNASGNTHTVRSCRIASKTTLHPFNINGWKSFLALEKPIHLEKIEYWFAASHTKAPALEDSTETGTYRLLVCDSYFANITDFTIHIVLQSDTPAKGGGLMSGIVSKTISPPFDVRG